LLLLPESPIFATMLQKEGADVILVSGAGDATTASCALENTENAGDSSSEISGGFDILGMGGSLLCLIHCLAPQLIALGILGAGIGSIFAGEIWDLVFWITCFWAVYSSASSTPFSRASLALWVSFFIFSLGLGLEAFAGMGKETSYAGSVLLIVAHSWNFRLQLSWSTQRKKMLHRNCEGSSCKA